MEKNCIYCGKQYTSKRSSRKYCSDNCKQMAYFKRNGLVLSGTDNVKYERPVNTENVKYANPSSNNVKYDPIVTRINFSDNKTQPEDRQEKAEQRNEATLANQSEQEISEQQSEPETSNFLTEQYEEPEYKWVESFFLKSIEKNQLKNNAYLFKKPLAYWNIDKVIHIIWVSIRLCCLLESMIKLSNYGKIDAQTLWSITDAFNRLTQSSAFKSLPDNYPYMELIKELLIKLNRLLQNGTYSQELKFSLSVQLKSKLISIRSEMLLYLPAMKFSELNFSEKINVLKKSDNEEEEEKAKPKKDWEYGFEAWKRKRYDDTD